jgi:hypothetical protein
MLLLLLVYHAFLEREKMHRFNRFYLIFSIIFGLTIPLLTINIHLFSGFHVLNHIDQINNRLANPSIQYTTQKYTAQVSPNNHLTAHQATSSAIYRTILIGIYIFISLFMAVRFFRNLHDLIKKIRNNKSIPLGKAKLILVNESKNPHSFFNYIFIDKKAYQEGMVDDAILIHEQSHARHHHSLDITFIELVKIVFWFNPIIYFYKKAIQLNHEFLADDSVISASNNIESYQKLLLTMQSVKNNVQLASSIKYSITKKRITMMTKKSPKLRKVCKQLALVPVLAGLLFAFSVRAKAQNKMASKSRIIGSIPDTSKKIDAKKPQKNGVVEDTLIQMRKTYVKLVDDYVNIQPVEENQTELEAAYKKMRSYRNKIDKIKDFSHKHKLLSLLLLTPVNPTQRIEANTNAPGFPIPSKPAKIDSVYYHHMALKFNKQARKYNAITPSLKNKNRLKGAYGKLINIHNEGAKIFLQIRKKNKNIRPMVPLPMRPKDKMMVYYRKHPKLAQDNTTILNWAAKDYKRGIKEYFNMKPVDENKVTLGIIHSQLVTFYNNWKGIFKKSNTTLILPSPPEAAWKRIRDYKSKHKNYN